jgi:hypothetical protein
MKRTDVALKYFEKFTWPYAYIIFCDDIDEKLFFV